jgi:alkaline phosphatase
MTSKAIDVLSKNSNGYFLMSPKAVEFDHALHGTNAARALTDTLAFDNAVKMALSKVDLSETLVIVTADQRPDNGL